jgi:hypothetical protein
MKFDDVRGMMMLPLPACGITGGCNFAAASSLCSLIYGLAKVLYTRPRKGLPGTGDGFVALLMQFYPWHVRENKQQKAGALYDLVRNPLAHALGVLHKPGQAKFNVRILKRPLDEGELLRLEGSTARPRGLPLAVTIRRRWCVVDVPALYWGIIRLFSRLAEDKGQMSKAEQRMS